MQYSKSMIPVDQSDVNQIHVWQLVMHGLVALFGAVTHAIRAHRLGQSKGLSDFILLTLMSSFSGMIFAFIALNTTNSLYFTLAAAGAGGFLGVEGMTYLLTTFKDVLKESLFKK